MRSEPSAVREAEAVESLLLDLLQWLDGSPRPYAETLEAWRTSCPRLPVWEEANDRGFIVRHREPGLGAMVSCSAQGTAHLRERRPEPRN
jgi:D-3-phosphoglycerate dehydrogenase / 2-oxoglutarate reductase